MERLPTIASLLWFLVLNWVALGLGGYLLRSLKIETVNPLRGLYLRLAIGLAMLSLGTTIAGHLHLWCATGAKVAFIILAIIVIPANLGFWNEWRGRFPERKHYSFEQTLLIIGICAMWVLLFLNSLAPIINFDAERHHYLMPKLYLEHGSFFDYPPNPFPTYPMSVEMLFLDGFALAGQQVASLIDWLLGLLIILATIEFCSRHLDETTGLLAAAMFSGLAFITTLVGNGYVDVAVTAFLLIGIFALIDWYNSHRLSEATLAGLLLGTAVSGKYYALLWAAFLALSTFWHWLRTPSVNKKAVAHGIGIILLVIVILAIPWYGRNWITHGNPVHPFLAQFLTGERLLADDVTTWAGSTGHPKTWLNFLRYLGDLTFLQGMTDRFSINYVHPFLCLFPIFGLFGLKRAVLRWCYIYSWLFTIYAFLLMPFQVRYFLTFEVLAFICVASGMKYLSVKRPILVIFVLLTLVPLGIEINETREDFILRRNVIIGRQTVMEYLADRRSDFHVFKYANEELPEGSKILFLRENTLYLHALHEVIEPALNFDDARAPDEMLIKLRQLGYTHVLTEVATMATFNVLDGVLDELPYEGSGGIVGEDELKFVEFDYWPLAFSIEEDRDMPANVLPAIIEVFSGEAVDTTPKAERYRLDLSPLRDKQYLTAYASLASELYPWYEKGIVAAGYFSGNTRFFDIREQAPNDDESINDEKNKDN
jgi:hypothetical protein